MSVTARLVAALCLANVALLGVLFGLRRAWFGSGSVACDEEAGRAAEACSRHLDWLGALGWLTIVLAGLTLVIIAGVLAHRFAQRRRRTSLASRG